MRKATLKNSLWALLVVAAYLGGMMHRGAGPEPSDSRPPSFDAKADSPSLLSRGLAGKPGASAAGRSSEAGGGTWLDSFRGPDRVIASVDMREAVAAVLRESDPVAANLHFAQLLEELTRENAAAAFEILENRGGSGNASRYLELLAHAWGRLDGETAVAAFDTLHGRSSEASKTAALAAWTADDPAAALAWLEGRASTDDRRADMAWERGVLAGLARRDVDVALQYLMNMPPDAQDRHVDVLIAAKLEEGVVAAADWALRLPGEDRMRTGALETVGMKFLDENLDGAKEWAASIAERPDAHEAVADIADSLATRDPAEAVAWVSSLPAGPSQDHAYEDLFENWTRSDPLAASESLTQMEPGPVQDNAIQAFAKTLARDNPEDALVWAGAMTDSPQRSNLQIDIARRWQKSAPDDSRAWITAHLPPELQARVLPPATNP